MKYIYYILEKHNNNVSGVISEDENGIRYNALTVMPVWDMFRGCDVDTLVKYYESTDRVASKDKITEHFGTIELTKDYYTALAHATGKARKAVAYSTENA